jgi:signal peptidase II
MGMELLVILLGLILDRVSKIWAINALSNEKIIIKDFFSFSYLENRGAAFGILQNKLIFLTIITIAVLVGIVYYMLVKKPSSLWVRLSLSLIVSGAIGNMIDRVYYKYVVDFILLHYKDKYYFPTFNVADIMVVIGTVILATCVIFEDK